MATAAELLAEVDTAISACLTSQSYTLRGRTQQRALLRDLMAARKDLLVEVQDGSNSGQMASICEMVPPT